MTQRIELFKNMTHRTEPFFAKYESKNRTLFLFMKTNMTLRIELFFEQIWFTLRIQHFWTFSCDSKNWTFFHMTQRLEPSVKNFDLQEPNLFFSMTQRIESLKKIWLKEWNLFSQKKLTPRIEPLLLIWLKELNFFSFNWEICLKELNFSQKKRCLQDFSGKYHSKFRTVFWMTQRIELLFNMTHRTEHFF